MRLTILTGEYPPYAGGVADYTYQVAHGLRQRGINVDVIVFRDLVGAKDTDVTFVGSAANPVSLWRASRIMRKGGPNRVFLVQYVPQMYGLKGMNFAFVVWLSWLTKNILWVMFHEVYVVAAEGSPWKQRLLAYITKCMAQRLSKRAVHCFASIHSFVADVSGFLSPGVSVEWLPVPSNISADVNPEEVVALRATLLEALPDGVLVGHFGTYSGLIPELLQEAIAGSRIRPNWRFVLIGRGSSEFVRGLQAKGIVGSETAVMATGELPPEVAARWIAACDVMLQPYPDGASSRRSSLMASLALGKAVVSNRGHLCDFSLETSRGLSLTDAPDADAFIQAVGFLVEQPAFRERLEVEACTLYKREFSLLNTVRKIDEALTFFPATQFATTKRPEIRH